MDDGRVTTRVALVDYIATGRAAEAGGDAALDEIALLAAAWLRAAPHRWNVPPVARIEGWTFGVT